jgi:hypothetical protein
MMPCREILNWSRLTNVLSIILFWPEVRLRVCGSNWLKPRTTNSGKVGKFLSARNERLPASIINKSRSHCDEYQGGLNLKPPVGAAI